MEQTAGTVLVVDDAELNLHVAKTLLTPYHLSVETVSGGYEALERVKAGKVYSVVFMDHMMPDLDGLETTKLMRGLGYTAPIVALSANSDDELDLFTENGFDGFVAKPIDPPQLETILKRFIADLPAFAPAEQTPHLSGTMTRSFLYDARKGAAVLESLLKKDGFGEEDWKHFTSQTHGLKGVLANISEPGLSDAAHTLELAGRNRDTAVMAAQTPEFLTRLRTVIGRLAEQPAGSNHHGEADDAYLRPRLETIIEACRMMDIGTVKQALNELKSKNWPFYVKERLDGMTDRLLCGDYDDIARAAEQLLKKQV
ncbi:MAG: response regulator [Oscillospiraceae bacterium]|nr:response regulator [Oscillospiraceae bacterium]